MHMKCVTCCQQDKRFGLSGILVPLHNLQIGNSYIETKILAGLKLSLQGGVLFSEQTWYMQSVESSCFTRVKTLNHHCPIISKYQNQHKILLETRGILICMNIHYAGIFSVSSDLSPVSVHMILNFVSLWCPIPILSVVFQYPPFGSIYCRTYGSCKQELLIAPSQLLVMMQLSSQMALPWTSSVLYFWILILKAAIWF